MPTYDYQCRQCGTVTEVIHSMLESGPTACEQCGGDLRRVLYPTGIIFKGSGFYRTDSRRQESSSGAKSSSDGASPGSGTKTSAGGPGGADGGGSGNGSAPKSSTPEASG